MDKVIVTLFSGLGIVFVYWFFFCKNETTIEASDSVEILVDGGYSPENIVIKKGKNTKVTFLRTDPSSCLEEVVLSDFHIRKYLPLNKKVTIELKPQSEGKFSFTCGMNMYHGTLIIK